VFAAGQEEKVEIETRAIYTRQDNRTLKNNEEVIPRSFPMVCSIELNDLKFLPCQGWKIGGS
jgi:hypothetical protein